MHRALHQWFVSSRRRMFPLLKHEVCEEPMINLITRWLYNCTFYQAKHSKKKCHTYFTFYWFIFPVFSRFSGDCGILGSADTAHCETKNVPVPHHESATSVFHMGILEERFGRTHPCQQLHISGVYQLHPAAPVHVCNLSIIVSFARLYIVKPLHLCKLGKLPDVLFWAAAIWCVKRRSSYAQNEIIYTSLQCHTIISSLNNKEIDEGRHLLWWEQMRLQARLHQNRCFVSTVVRRTRPYPVSRRALLQAALCSVWHIPPWEPGQLYLNRDRECEEEMELGTFRERLQAAINRL